MDLRYLALMLVLGWAPAPGAVRHYHLDAETVVTVTLASDAPTTCVFPAPPTALEAVGVTTDLDGDAPVLLSHQEGSRHFSLRALRPDATAGLNVLLGKDVYALRLVSGPNADRIVRFQGDPPDLDKDALLQLIDRTRTQDHRVRPPGSMPVTPFRPGTVTTYLGFRAITEAVYRYENANALVFHVRLDNPGAEPVAYDPDGLGARLGREVWFADAVDASGSVPAGSTTQVWFVIRCDLTATAPFSIIVPNR